MEKINSKKKQQKTTKKMLKNELLVNSLDRVYRSLPCCRYSNSLSHNFDCCSATFFRTLFSSGFTFNRIKMFIRPH